MNKLILSEKIISIIKAIRDTEIASKILALHKCEVNSPYNYISISNDSNDLVTFIPSSRLEKIIKEKPVNYRVSDRSRYLKLNSPSNKTIFKLLNYDPIDHDLSQFIFGTIASEAISPSSGNTFCKLKYKSESGDDRFIVYNKNVLLVDRTNNDDYLWDKSTNVVKIGRFVKSLIPDINPTDLENFVNKFKASYDINSNELLKFDIVSNDDIKKWYKSTNYTSGGGMLNNSCMANVNSSYLSIYSDNDIKMIILYDKDGYIENGKFKSSKIRGRALLWENVTMNGKPITLMDRVYTTKESDVELFKKYAIDNGWWYKKNQSMEPDDYLTNGTVVEEDVYLEVKINNSYFTKYPFVDTFCYLNTSNNTLSNIEKYDNRALRHTDGTYRYC